MEWVLTNKISKMPFILASCCPLIVAVGGFMSYRTLSTDKTISILFLIICLLSIVLAYYLIMNGKKKKESALETSKISFKDGLFIYESNESVLVFPPTAIKTCKSSGSGTILVSLTLDTGLVDSVGDNEVKPVLNVYMTNETFVQFQDFYVEVQM